MRSERGYLFTSCIYDLTAQEGSTPCLELLDECTRGGGKLYAMNTARGFTIVELLVAIVVIAILAAISMSIYNGIQSQAVETTLKADLKNAATQLALHYATEGVYPEGSTPPDLLHPSNHTYFQYTSDGNGYCLTATPTPAQAGVTAYHISSTNTLTEGVCEGHTVEVSGNEGVVTRQGFTDLSFSYAASNLIRAPIGEVANGSWMIVVMAYTQNIDPVPPSGWITLVARKTTNTLQTSIFAKIKQSGDAVNQDFQVSGQAATNALLMWGTGSTGVSTWTVGGFGDRYVNATPTTVTTPTITTAAANSLVLSIATERTTAGEIINDLVLSGASLWAYVSQPSGNANKIHTITVGYNNQVLTGISQPMTIVYPNSQTYNATAIQVALPPGG